MIKIICEAGLNWKNFDEAIKYAEIAKELKADIVKYQFVRNESLYSQMSLGKWKTLKSYCDKINIEFLATPSSEDILSFLLSIGMKRVKIGSDRVPEFHKLKPSGKCLISNGYFNYKQCNMYCVSLYPCDPKFIDFNEMSNKKYIAFSDHTLEYDIEWCKKIKACKNIQYVEKHFKLSDDCIDSHVSLDYNEMEEFIRNLHE